jgi:hypothetical protein
MTVKIVQNKVLGKYYAVVGPHQSPISGPFDSRQEGWDWLKYRQYLRDHWRVEPITFEEWKEMQ